MSRVFPVHLYTALVLHLHLISSHFSARCAHLPLSSICAFPIRHVLCPEPRTCGQLSNNRGGKQLELTAENNRPQTGSSSREDGVRTPTLWCCFKVAIKRDAAGSEACAHLWGAWLHPLWRHCHAHTTRCESADQVQLPHSPPLGSPKIIVTNRNSSTYFTEQEE